MKWRRRKPGVYYATRPNGDVWAVVERSLAGGWWWEQWRIVGNGSKQTGRESALRYAKTAASRAMGVGT